MATDAINIRDISHKYEKNEVLRAVSFDVKSGEYVAIVGPNGAGKTTLLKKIIRILDVKKGAIKINGKDALEFTRKDLAKEVSYVPQSNGRSHPFNVYEFLLISRYPYLNPFSDTSQNDEKEIGEVLASVNMEQFKDRFMDTLSSGERQKIMIAGALIQRAKILLLDEPTTFLDPKHEREISLILKRLNKSLKITILMVTHNINLAALVSDKILALKSGEISYFGFAKDFMEQDTLRSVYEKEFELIAHPKKDIKIIIPEAIE